jgi:NAD(P)-dependent dehydrogenase (short-subunit alcohol dehydrogenase family)
VVINRAAESGAWARVSVSERQLVSPSSDEILRFDGRGAVVTGAGRGLGRTYAKLLGSRGACVVVNDLGGEVDGSGADPMVAQAVVDEIVAEGGDAVASTSTVTTSESSKEIIEIALEHFGRIDIVVNSVGILRPADFPDATLDDVRAEHDVHVAGQFNVCHAAWPHLVASGAGRVITTGSSGFLGVPYLTPYAIAKAGVIGLTRSMAYAGLTTNINVNQVNPVADSTRMSNFRFTHRQSMRGAPEAERVRTEFRNPVELVAPPVAVLAHERCPSTGEMYEAIAGRVNRFFVGETPGYQMPSADPEELLAHWGT